MRLLIFVEKSHCVLHDPEAKVEEQMCISYSPVTAVTATIPVSLFLDPTAVISM